MTEHLPLKPADQEKDVTDELLLRDAVALLRSHDREVIQLAAEVGSRLPLMGVVDDELVALQSLEDQVRQQLNRQG